MPNLLVLAMEWSPTDLFPLYSRKTVTVVDSPATEKKQQWYLQGALPSLEHKEGHASGVGHGK